MMAERAGQARVRTIWSETGIMSRSLRPEMKEMGSRFAS